jgi:RimJ/RimL family protein N-acetyltransferase
VIGGVALLPLPPECTDLEIGWQLEPGEWGHGYGGETGHAVAHQAFESAGISEVFAVVRPGNQRGVATARRVGMEWVGETDKYYGLFLQVYRLTKADLDLPEPACA